VAKNPNYYHAYVLAGDYSYKKGEWQKALVIINCPDKSYCNKEEEDHIKRR